MKEANWYDVSERSMRNRMGNALVIVGAIGLFLAVQPYGESRHDGNRGLSTWTFRFGFPSSPLIAYSSDGGGREEDSGLKLHWWSRSAAFLVVGAVLVVFGTRLTRRVVLAPRTIDDSEEPGGPIDPQGTPLPVPDPRASHDARAR